MTQILGISGKKQAGKNSLCNFLYGYAMCVAKSAKRFNINDDGELFVNCQFLNADGVEETGMGHLDIMRTDREFIAYASVKIWPYIRQYYFADNLKYIANHVFSIDQHKLYGTNEEKNEKIDITWRDISFVLPPRTVGELRKSGEIDNQLTAREFLECFGTNICRRIKAGCWSESCLVDIVSNNSELAIITDVRFPDEVDSILAMGGKVVRLTRNTENGNHITETALDSYDKFSYICDNANMTVREQGNDVLKELMKWGWITSEIETVGQ